MLFDDLVVLDCDFINIYLSAEGKEQAKRVWTRKDDEMNQMLCHLCFWFTMNAPMCDA